MDFYWFFFSVEFYCCDPSFFPSENLQLSSKVSEYLLAIPRRDGGRQRDAARKRTRNGGALSRICQPLDPFPTAEITSSHVGRSMQHLSQQPIENAIPGAPLYSLFSSGDKTAIRRKTAGNVRDAVARFPDDRLVQKTASLFRWPKKCWHTAKRNVFHWFRADIADGWRLSDNRTESKCQFQDRERQLDEPLQRR